MRSLVALALIALIPAPLAAQQAVAVTSGGGHSSISMTVPMGGDARFNGLVLRPLRVIEDSRCRPTHQCIQAGRLLVLVALDGQQRTFELGKPQQTAVGWMTLTGGSPLTPGGVLPPIPPRLTFTLTR